MPRRFRSLLAAAMCGAAPLAFFAAPAVAQKSGGTLRIYNSTDSPSASIHEEATVATVVPLAAVFNNLVQYDRSKLRNGFDTINPELAESWALAAAGTPHGARQADSEKCNVSSHDAHPESHAPSTHAPATQAAVPCAGFGHARPQPPQCDIVEDVSRHMPLQHSRWTGPPAQWALVVQLERHE